MNTIGTIFKTSIFGESHGNGIGVVMDGVPAGISLTEDDFIADLSRRKAGAKGTTPRKEDDLPEILSGVFNGKTTGAPLAVIFRNGNTIKGLTTAAGIWATAGIGLAIGSGMYILGILTTAVVAVIQIIMHRHTIGGDSTTLSRMRCTTSEPKVFRKQLDEYLEANGIQITDVKIERNENGSTTYELELRIGREMTISDVTGFLEAMDGVQKISFEMEG